MDLLIVGGSLVALVVIAKIFAWLFKAAGVILIPCLTTIAVYFAMEHYHPMTGHAEAVVCVVTFVVALIAAAT
jgi:hypothetical protein